MDLTLEPDIVTWPQTHYVFVEKIGPFATNAPLAWQELHKLLPATAAHNTVTAYFSLYSMPQQLYRAGVSLAAPPQNLPAGLGYELFPGGKYSRFTLIGPYSQLCEATGLLFTLVADMKLPLRDAYNIENYVNDPRTTPEAELITEIMFPTA